MRRVDSLEKTLMLERVRAEGDEYGRGWDGWMVSLTQWTWVLASSERLWRTGKPVLWFMELQGQTRLRDWKLTTVTKCLLLSEKERDITWLFIEKLLSPSDDHRGSSLSTSSAWWIIFYVHVHWTGHTAETCYFLAEGRRDKIKSD